MPLPVSKLRRWFAVAAILMVATVAGMYFYARFSLRRTIRNIPAKIGLEIQQTADGFSISKSEQGHTLFRVSASKAVQFKEGGRAELHDVKIIVYGKDSDRFDQIAGDDFEYDPASGNVSAKGTVLIDLEANPEGMRHSDQMPPAQTRNPIHLETDGLTFNKNTGDASTTGKVMFQTPQASGSAVGVQYVAKTGAMELLSAVAVTVNRPQQVHLEADRGLITKQPHQVFLTAVHMTREQQQARADQATFFLRPDNTVERIFAEGNVESDLHSQPNPKSQTSGSETHERSDRAELFLTGTRNQLTSAILSGNVQLSTERKSSDVATDVAEAQPSNAAAGRVTLQFAANSAGQQILKTVHAEDGVRLSQKNMQGRTGVLAAASSGAPTGTASPPKQGAQDVEMTAPVMDFIVKDGHQLERADTTGPPQIVITQPSSNLKTVVTAVKFTAKFTANNRLATLHGEPDAKIVSGVLDATKLDSTKLDATKVDASKAGAPGHSDRVSTSQMLDVVFLPQGGVASITQTGNLAYTDGTQKAWAQRGEYTTADQLLVLSGSPRVIDNSMTTTAQTITMYRATGDAVAEGNVKSTYSDLKPQPDGGMLASSDPIHVTGRTMTVHRSPSIAVYTGDARLWQNANVVEAPTLRFDRDHRSLVADGVTDGAAGGVPEGPGQAGVHAPPTQPVSTVLVQVDKSGKVTPVHITSARLDYSDPDRKIFLDGGVTAKSVDSTLTAQQATVFLLPRNQTKTGPGQGTPGQVERIIAQGGVVVTQPTRHATGDRLVYTSADDKFVLTGGPPSIFDAERGKITGDSLTFYRHDDRVLVEGRETSPAVSRTQVAR